MPTIRTYRVYVDTDAALEALEAVEARDIEDLLDDIERQEAHRIVECDDCLFAMAEVPAAWIGRGARA